uniref:Putative secreted protein n=1 Tax=Anopheles darlingi TaxID=43151 RepID=A0A2M4D4P1_ANODA
MILSKAFCFFSAALAIDEARSTSSCRSSTSVARRCFVFSRAMHFWFSDSIVSSASARRACSLRLASSSSSARATPSDSYLLRHSWASALALLSWR